MDKMIKAYSRLNVYYVPWCPISVILCSGSPHETEQHTKKRTNDGQTDTVRWGCGHVSSLFMWQQTEITLPADWQMTLGVWFWLREERIVRGDSLCTAIVSRLTQHHWSPLWVTCTNTSTRLSQLCASQREVWSIHYWHQQWRMARAAVTGVASSPTHTVAHVRVCYRRGEWRE